MKLLITLVALFAIANAYNPKAEELVRYRRSYGGSDYGGGLSHYNGPHCKSVLVSCAPIVQKVPCKSSYGGHSSYDDHSSHDGHSSYGGQSHYGGGHSSYGGHGYGHSEGGYVSSIHHGGNLKQKILEKPSKQY